METQEISENAKIKKLEREIQILRFQNDRLLYYLRSNKTFYKKRLDDCKKELIRQAEEIKLNRKEKIIRSRNENISD